MDSDKKNKKYQKEATMHCFTVSQDIDGHLGVYVSHTDNLTGEISEYLQTGEKIIAVYPLEGSLEALGILVENTVTTDENSKNSFGNQVEKLLSKMVSDIYSMK